MKIKSTVQFYLFKYAVRKSSLDLCSNHYIHATFYQSKVYFDFDEMCQVFLFIIMIMQRFYIFFCGACSVASKWLLQSQQNSPMFINVILSAAQNRNLSTLTLPPQKKINIFNQAYIKGSVHAVTP